MNSISWFLYFANALDNLTYVVGPMAFFSFVGFGAAVVSMVVVGVLVRLNDKEAEDFIPTMRWLFRTATAIWLVSTCLYVATPGKDTIYAIAASQVGERISQSETVRGLTDDATKALRVWINSQLEKKK